MKILKKIANFVKFNPYVRMPLYKKILHLHKTPLRVFNYYLTNAHMALGLSHLYCAPWGIDIEPIRACNLACPLCPVGTESYQRTKLSFDQYKRIVDPVAKYLFMIDFCFWGEPLLNPELGEMVSYAKQKKIATIVRTNLNYLPEKTARELVEYNCDIILVGLESPCQEAYAKYRRGGNVELIKKNLLRLNKLKNELKSLYPKIIYYAIITEESIKDKEALEEFCTETGGVGVYYSPTVIDFYLRQKQGFLTSNAFYKEAKKVLDLDDKYRIYYQCGSAIVRKNKIMSCWMPYMNPAVSSDGKLNGCWHVFYREDSLAENGETNHSFWGMWNSKKAKAIRRYLKCRKSDNRIDIPCRRCTMLKQFPR